MKKVDFRIKGTKLPVIPVGTLFNVVDTGNTWKRTSHGYKGFVSFGPNSPDEIVADDEGYERKFFYIFKLSTIERLAKEQGMLYEKEEERDWTGVRFRYRKGIDIYSLKKENGLYNFGDAYNYTQNEVDSIFSDGTWIEIKEKTEDDKRTRMAETLTENIFGKDAFTPSIQSLLQRATVAEYHIRTGCQMFIGVDEVERLEQMKACERELKDAVTELNSLINK